MKAFKFGKILKDCRVWCLAFLATTSCTYDYFRDENNFRLYVPQIEDGSIERFYVAFHSMDGSHSITRELVAPFDQDDLMKQGILRFKLPPGKDYNITCFADYTPNSITVGERFDESQKFKDIDESQSLYQNVYRSHTTNPRSLFLTATAYPLGHPQSREAITANIDTDRQYKGEIVMTFIELPAQVSRIDTYYRGLATTYRFNGAFDHYRTTDERLRGTYSVSDNRLGNTVEIHDRINPSIGTGYGTRGDVPPVTSTDPDLIEMEIILYTETGDRMGTIHFDENEYNRLPPDKKPVDRNGDPITRLSLMPKDQIRFIFKDFTVIGVELTPWGDIEEGGTTPM